MGFYGNQQVRGKRELLMWTGVQICCVSIIVLVYIGGTRLEIGLVKVHDSFVWLIFLLLPI